MQLMNSVSPYRMALDRWSTHRGDEWWYQDESIEMTVVPIDTAFPPKMNIEEIESKAGQLNASRPHELLWLTGRRFPEAVVTLSVTARLRPLVASLVASNSIIGETIQSRYSETFIVKAVVGLA